MGPTAALDGLEKKKILANGPGVPGCHAAMPCHWSLNSWKMKALCSLEMSRNTAATRSCISEYLDREPRFLGHPPCSLVPMPTELNHKCQMGRAVAKNGKMAMWGDGGVQTC